MRCGVQRGKELAEVGDRARSVSQDSGTET